MTEGAPRPARKTASKPPAKKPAARKPRAKKPDATPPPAAAAEQAPAPEPVRKPPAKAATPMRIVVRVHGWPPRHNAGSEWMTHSMLRALVARGHDCSVWLSRYSADRHPYELDGVQVVPFAARMDFADAAKHADVLISYWENVPATGALARGFGRPFVVLCHNASRQVLRNAGVAGAALVVYNSEYVRAEADAMYAEYGKAQRPIRSIVVRPPVFADEYSAAPGDRVTLINLSADKGGHVFWKLAERLPGVQFLGVRGAYGEQIIKDLPNVEVVDHLPGNRMRDEVYGRTRVLLVPSAHESWGRVAVEAMCSGIPVIAHPTPGLAECLGSAGIFAERDDLDAWASAVEALTDETHWSAAAERSRQRAKELDPTDDLAAWCEAIESLRG